jgi:hypothetical protein
VSYGNLRDGCGKDGKTRCVSCFFVTFDLRTWSFSGVQEGLPLVTVFGGGESEWGEIMADEVGMQV